jgi:hypothetical protein
MPGNKRPRKPRPAAPKGPPKSVRDYAKAYRCSHCRSRVNGVYEDGQGVWRMMIGHDGSCPVLRGTLSDAPDAVRAALTIGRPARLIGPRQGAE